MTDETIFATALEKSNPAERTAFLDAACAGDARLRQRVAALLRAHEAAGTFLEPLPFGSPSEQGQQTLALTSRS